MAQVKLTKREIDKLITTKKIGERFFDTEIPAFGIKVFPSGQKSFFVRYGSRKHRRELVIGKYGIITPEMARTKARQILGKITTGHDPLEKREQTDGTLTFGNWVEQYLDQIKLRKKHPREDVRYLTHAVGLWGSYQIKQVTSEDIKKEFMKIVKSGKHTKANRWLASIKACLNEAWRENKIDSNPAMKVKTISESEPRTRVLNDQEFGRLIATINELPDIHTRTAFYLLIETGARLSEVLHAKWEHIDFDARIWRIPSTKSGKPQMIPLLPSLIERLMNTPRTSDYIIAGRSLNKPRYDLRKPWERLIQLAGLANVHIHDLRRTFGLQITRAEGLHMASRLLRHSDVRITERHYAPLDMNSMEQALQNRKKRFDPSD